MEEKKERLEAVVGGANNQLPEYRDGKYYCPECGGEVEKSSMGGVHISYYCPECDWELEL